MRRASSDSGFSLLEATIAVSLMASLSLVGWSALRQTSKMKQRTDKAADVYDMGQLAADTLVRDVSMAYLSLHDNLSESRTGTKTQDSTDTKSTRTFFYAQQSGGFNTQLAAFTHMGHALSMATEPSSDTAAVFYRLEPGGSEAGTFRLVRTETKWIQTLSPTQLPTQDIERTVLCDNVLQAEVWYFSPRENKWTNTWSTRTGEAQQGRLPSRVTLKLVLQTDKRDPVAFFAEAQVMVTQPIDNTPQ